MVERFTSKPLELPPREHSFKRVDLVFHGLDHSQATYEGQVFLDPRGVGRSADRDHRAYVGSFFVFGHNGCFGEVGHCDIPAERDPFDLRPPHHLEPATRIVTVTEAVERLLERDVSAAKVTVVAVTEGRAPAKVLAFDKVRMVTYA
jgi:hypothetical protein